MTPDPSAGQGEGSNAQAAEIFRTIADLLDVLGEKFKPEAYRRAARSIESLTESLRAVDARGELRSIPGVGEAISEKIEEYLTTGSIAYFERLKNEVPPGLVELMRLPGLGPKTARRFWVELGVEGPAELRDAVAQGRLVGLKGFGAKKIDQIRSALESKAGASASARRPIEDVYPIAKSLIDSLRTAVGVDTVEVAGSFRRGRETVGDLDILVTTRDPPKAFATFTAHPFVGEVKMRGDTKETVLLKGGLQVDLRVVRPEEFGAALQYFTGSKDHNVRLRSLARDKGLKVNEYGVFRGEERVAGTTEEEVYASLGLAWIPPEIREGRDEIYLASHGKVPVLVGTSDLEGDWHVHLPLGAGAEDVNRLLSDARRRHFRYLGIVVGGVAADGTPWTLSEAARARLDSAKSTGVRAERAIECGPGVVPRELASLSHEYRIVRPLPDSGRTVAPASAPVRVVAHLSTASLPPSTPLKGWAENAKKWGAGIEVGPGTERLDSTAAAQLREVGAAIHLPTNVGRDPDDPTEAVALAFARRAAVGPALVVNARAFPTPRRSIG